jgi:hypothetical protein
MYNDNWTSQKVVDWDDYINPRASRASRTEYRTLPNGETYRVETSYRRDGRAFRVAVFANGNTMDLD